MKQRLLSAAISMLVVAVAAAGLAPAPASSQEQSLVVTSAADSGPGTLRDALERATPGTTITFDPTIFPPQNPATIGVTSPLPWLTQGQVTIDASNAGVILDGSELPHGEVIDGLVVTSNGNVIRGSQILHFTGSGLSIIGGAQDNTVGGDRTVGAGPSGQGNVISGNHDLGLSMRDPGTANNVITGNYIGTDVTGSLALGNGNHGIMIQRSADNTIGGLTPGERNVISGNEAAGVRIEHPESRGNVVIGNYIGTDASGTVALGGNPHSGVAIDWGATQNRIGGIGEGERHIISGNEGYADGVSIRRTGTEQNLVLANYIGLDASGTRLAIVVQVCSARTSRASLFLPGTQNLATLDVQFGVDSMAGPAKSSAD